MTHRKHGHLVARKCHHGKLVDLFALGLLEEWLDHEHMVVVKVHQQHIQAA